MDLLRLCFEGRLTTGITNPITTLSKAFKDRLPKLDGKVNDTLKTNDENCGKYKDWYGKWSRGLIID